MLTYYCPKTIEEALAVLSRDPGTVLPYAGGTDLMPRWTLGAARRPDSILDLKHIEGLRGTSRLNGEIRVGACTSMTEIENDPLIRSEAPILAEAAARIACPQIRNRATIGGNLCNASPAADTAIPLLLLDAVLEVAFLGPDGVGTRQVPVVDFFHGPGLTVLADGEILTQILFKLPPAGVFAAWDKFGTRPAMEIAVASVGLLIGTKAGTVVHARIGYGSVAPVPLRGCRAEEELVGGPLSAEAIEKCECAAREEIAPITDVRASEAYRREVVGVMLRRMLESARGS